MKRIFCIAAWDTLFCCEGCVKRLIRKANLHRSPAREDAAGDVSRWTEQEAETCCRLGQIPVWKGSGNNLPCFGRGWAESDELRMVYQRCMSRGWTDTTKSRICRCCIAIITPSGKASSKVARSPKRRKRRHREEQLEVEEPEGDAIEGDAMEADAGGLGDWHRFDNVEFIGKNVKRCKRFATLYSTITADWTKSSDIHLIHPSFEIASQKERIRHEWIMCDAYEKHRWRIHQFRCGNMSCSFSQLKHNQWFLAGMSCQHSCSRTMISLHERGHSCLR